MTEKQFRSVRVYPGCNVSSTFTYSFRVAAALYRRGTFKRTLKFYYSPGLGGSITLPRYVEADIERQIVVMHDQGDIKFYEYDRDGKARWENLRYYDPDEWGGIVAWMDNQERG